MPRAELGLNGVSVLPVILQLCNVCRGVACELNLQPRLFTKAIHWDLQESVQLEHLNAIQTHLSAIMPPSWTCAVVLPAMDVMGMVTQQRRQRAHHIKTDRNTTEAASTSTQQCLGAVGRSQ
uniref:Uncharacterized protein n=1 Tax=Eutreptiella gymnastica TaxID=73025 RepID=A0A7S4L9P6_9EUGL